METAPTPSPCVSGYRCVYFPDHVDSDCLLKTGTIWSSWAIFLPSPPVMQLAPQSVPIQVQNSSEGGKAGWGGCGGEQLWGPEARQEEVVLSRMGWNFTHYTCSSEGIESDTLHQYLQGP